MIQIDYKDLQKDFGFTRENGNWALTYKPWLDLPDPESVTIPLTQFIGAAQAEIGDDLLIDCERKHMSKLFGLLTYADIGFTYLAK